uniref:DNA repair protein RAD51 homolog 3 n=1 Tax=Auxenochlorella protothecoides TaxID=3075 RepID=A0A1D2A1V4_AUXPR
MTSDVSSLPLCPTLRSKLSAAGFTSAAAVAQADPARLAADAAVTLEDAQRAQHAADARTRSGLAGALSAKALYDRERRSQRIITFCAGLDSILGGGVGLQQITEVCGGPGLGKTQLGMQLALDVQIPDCFGGLGGEALYVDAEGGLTLERLTQMADALAAHLRRVAAARGDARRAQAAAALTRERMFDAVHLYRVHDLAELLAVVDGLVATLAARPAIRLVVVDSIAFPFRQDHADLAARTRQLAQLGQSLMEVAVAHDVAVRQGVGSPSFLGARGWRPSRGRILQVEKRCGLLGRPDLHSPGGRAAPPHCCHFPPPKNAQVVLTNHVTTRPGEDGGAPPRLIPVLGDTWAHVATSRLMLYWEAGARRAFLYKSPSQPPASCEYLVTGEGIRGRRQPAKRGPEGECRGEAAKK